MRFDKLNRVAEIMILECVNEKDWNDIIGDGSDDIVLLLNGKEVNINKFASYLEKSFDTAVQEQAEKLSITKSPSIGSIINVLCQIKEQVDMASNCIDNAISTEYERNDE